MAEGDLHHKEFIEVRNEEEKVIPQGASQKPGLASDGSSVVIDGKHDPLK